MSAILFTVALLAILAYLIYYYFTRNFNHWKERGVVGPKPEFFFGNFKKALSGKQNYGYTLDDIYKAYKKIEDFVGIYHANNPQILILNPELVKKIMITDFNSFSKNDSAPWSGERKDFLFSDHPFLIHGPEWKEKRSELIPGLTPAKMKIYYPIVKSVCAKLTRHIKDNEKDYENYVDAEELLARFTGEVLCDIVWGLEAGAFSSKNEVEFIKNSRKLVLDFFTGLGTFFTISCFPLLKRFWKIDYAKSDTETYFRNLAKLAIESRINGKDRNDFLQFLIQLQEKKHLTHDNFVGRQLIFVFDGIDTTAVVTSHVLLGIAKDKSIQNRLRQLISEVAEEDGTLDCDTLQNLTFLDNIVNEGLRMFTPFATGPTKRCTQAYELVGDNGKVLQLRPNDVVVLPTHSFHMDSDYYEDPEKFNPDRFDEENGGIKKFRDAGVHFPFGYGPRICLGQKLAVILTKAAVVELVRNFEIQIHEKTRTDYVCDPAAFLIKLEGGIHLKLKALANDAPR